MKRVSSLSRLEPEAKEAARVLVLWTVESGFEGLKKFERLAP
jgi:hypothetical protein